MSTSTPSRKDRDSRGGGIITYHKSCVNLTRRLDLEHEHVESMWYELKTKLHNILSICLSRPMMRIIILSIWEM
jgi:hypothetical protein